MLGAVILQGSLPAGGKVLVVSCMFAYWDGVESREVGGQVRYVYRVYIHCLHCTQSTAHALVIPPNRTAAYAMMPKGNHGWAASGT